MSDQHHARGAWGAREDAVWWPGTITTADQTNLHHQQILNQHHQQQQNHLQQQQQQQIHQVVVQQQQQTNALNEAQRNNSTTSTVATQQLFSYKMASSFPTSGVTVSTSNAPTAYDYRLGMSTMVARPGDAQTLNSSAPGTQWWYTTAGQNTLENLQQHQQQQQQQQNQAQAQQHQTQNLHNVHSSNATTVSVI